MQARQAGRHLRALLGPRLRRWWPALLIGALAAFLVWPCPAGVMPLSQDHPVHLSRAFLMGELLREGRVSGWSSAWYFGFPLGELYPVLGDLLVVALRAVTFGGLSWQSSYALVFAGAYALLGLSLLRVSRAAEVGPWPAVLGAVTFHLDPGAHREGGWAYTVTFGVWMQAVACALTWWALADLATLLRSPTLEPRRLVGVAALLALAVLAHPFAVPLLLVGLALLLPLVGFGAGAPRAALVAGAATALGLALSAWWLAPFVAHRAWMGSYGELSTIPTRALEGVFAQNMSPLVGLVAAAGLLGALVRGARFARFVAAFTLVLWALGVPELWARLGDLVESLRAVPHQRFLVAAKPGLHLCAGWALVAVARAGTAPWRRGERGGRALLALLAPGALLGGTLVSVTRPALDEGVGRVQTNRVRGDPAFDAEYARYARWAADAWRSRDEPFRFAYEASRHSHVFGDAVALTGGAPAYKIGYLPGEAFVHKLESDHPTVLDRLRVRYVVSVEGLPGVSRVRARPAPLGAAPTGLASEAPTVRRFGRIRVVERPLRERIVRLVGAGEVEVLRDDPDGGGVVVRLARVLPGSRLEFHVAGHPRWQVLRDGAPVEWFEMPVIGDGGRATQRQRRAGEAPATRRLVALPSDPLLLAVDAEDGTYELVYRRWVAADVVGVGATALASLCCLALLAGRSRKAERALPS